MFFMSDIVTDSPHKIVRCGFTANFLVKPATFLHFSAGTGTSPENLLAELELVPEPNCCYFVGCW